jgi:hypothetical protein
MLAARLPTLRLTNGCTGFLSDSWRLLLSKRRGNKGGAPGISQKISSRFVSQERGESTGQQKIAAN